MKKKSGLAPRDVEFLYEMGALRFIQRTWRQFFRTDVANNTEHTFRVMWTALIIARHEGVTNEEKIMKIALVHDIGESRCLDTNYVSKIYSTRDEEKAIRDMVEDSVIAEEFIDLFLEYKDRSTIEAKIVKDADHLDVDFEIQEMAAMGNNPKKHWKRVNVRDMLFTLTGKKLWDELYQANPNDWHVSAHEKYRGKKQRLT